MAASSWLAVALLAAAGAAALLVPPPLGPGRPRRGEAGPGRGRRPATVGAVGGAAAALVAAVPGRATVAALVLTGAVAAGAVLVRRARRRVSARATAARVQEACDLLAGDLAAGLPPVRALARAAADWDPLAPVARAAELGGDVADALRRAAAEPGAGDLARLAAAWQVSLRTGQGLADPVARTAGALRRTRATRRVVDSELASARATARLLAALPVLALLVGGGAGGEPWRFLLATTPGLVCLALGLGAALLGTAWIERIADDVEARA